MLVSNWKFCFNTFSKKIFLSFNGRKKHIFSIFIHHEVNLSKIGKKLFYLKIFQVNFDDVINQIYFYSQEIYI